MDVVTKSVEADIKPVDSEKSNGEFEVILSTDALDRDGERLHTNEWKTPLPKKIHFDSDHGMSVEKTVGSGEPQINDQGQLVVRGSYAGTPHAQMVRQLVKEGHITSTSVTFQMGKTQKDAAPQRELLNGTFCAVPANPEAVVLSSKSAKPDAAAQFKAAIAAVFKDFGASGNNPVSHDGMVQAIHDAASHLGAECVNEAEADPGTDEGANKSVTQETSGSKDAGSPQESPDDSPAEVATKAAADAPAEVPAEAADDSADDAEKERLALKARSLAFLTMKNV